MVLSWQPLAVELAAGRNLLKSCDGRGMLGTYPAILASQHRNRAAEGWKHTAIPGLSEYRRTILNLGSTTFITIVAGCLVIYYPVRIIEFVSVLMERLCSQMFHLPGEAA